MTDTKQFTVHLKTQEEYDSFIKAVKQYTDIKRMDGSEPDRANCFHRCENYEIEVGDYMFFSYGGHGGFTDGVITVDEAIECLNTTYGFTPKTGDTVLVRDSDPKGWHEAIYLCTIPGKTKYKYVVVNSNYEDEYEDGREFHSSEWRYMKPLPKEEPKEALDGKVATIDGVEYLLTLQK